MTTPFEILGVAEDADDSGIKKAYLARVREFPPERDPEHFQVIRAAYETLRGPRDRIAWRLFTSNVPDPAPLITTWLASGKPRRLDLSSVYRSLEAGIKELPPT